MHSVLWATAANNLHSPEEKDLYLAVKSFGKSLRNQITPVMATQNAISALNWSINDYHDRDQTIKGWLIRGHATEKDTKTIQRIELLMKNKGGKTLEETLGDLKKNYLNLNRNANNYYNTLGEQVFGDDWKPRINRKENFIATTPTTVVPAVVSSVLPSPFLHPIPPSASAIFQEDDMDDDEFYFPKDSSAGRGMGVSSSVSSSVFPAVIPSPPISKKRKSLAPPGHEFILSVKARCADGKHVLIRSIPMEKNTHFESVYLSVATRDATNKVYTSINHPVLIDLYEGEEEEHSHEETTDND